VRPRGSRPAPAPVATPVEPVEESTRPPVDPPARRRPLMLIGSIVAGILLIGGVATAVALTGANGSALTPTQSAAPAKPTGINAVVGVPAPVLDGTATSEDGTQVTFTVSNPSPQEGDVFRWARAENPDQPTLSKTADITVEGIVPGSTVCVDIYLQRADGKISEANRACNR